jgi:hypothetical protein
MANWQSVNFPAIIMQLDEQEEKWFLLRDRNSWNLLYSPRVSTNTAIDFLTCQALVSACAIACITHFVWAYTSVLKSVKFTLPVTSSLFKINLLKHFSEMKAWCE